MTTFPSFSVSRIAPVAAMAALVLSYGCIRAIPSQNQASIETAEASVDDEPAIEDTIEVAADAPDEITKVKVTTDVGEFVIEVHSKWAPIGAPHWLKLVREGYYNDTRFFRVVPDFMAQTGISGDPAMNEKYGEATIRDDRVVASNKRGYVTFAQTGFPNSRSTQWFINFKDNSFLDTSGQGFMPFGKVVEGMAVVDKISPKHGERPDQGAIKARGNEYLDGTFPGLTKIIKIEVVGNETASVEEAAPASADGKAAAPAEATETASVE